MRVALTIWFILLSALSFRSSAQPLTPFNIRVGKEIPNLTFDNVKYYRSSTLSLKEFRGKWVVIDFGGPNCVACIIGIPKLARIQQEFHSKLQVLLVEDLVPTSNAVVNEHSDWRQRTYAMYDKLIKKNNINLPMAFDTSLIRRWQIGLPFIIIIDPNGITKFITSAISREEICKIINNENVTLSKPDDIEFERQSSQYNFRYPLLISGNQANGGIDSDFVYRSMLVRWNSKQPTYGVYYYKNRVEAFCLDLSNLYRLAYVGKIDWDSNDSLYGNYYYAPCILSKDSLIFHTKGAYSSTPTEMEHTFSYSLKLPGLNEKAPLITLVDQQILQEVLKKDLALNFPYDVTIELLPREVYFLTANLNTKSPIVTRGETPLIHNLKSEGFEVKNQPFSVFSRNLLSQIPDFKTAIVIDETGIEHNVDIKLDCNMTDYEDIVRELKNHGFYLKKGLKKLKVLVIRDKIL